MCEGPNLSSSNFLKAIQIQLANETRNPSMTKMSGKNFLFKNFLISNFDHRPILAPTDCIGIGRVLNKQDLTSRIFFTFLMNGVSISFNFLKWILFYNSIRILDKNLKYYSTATFFPIFYINCHSSAFPTVESWKPTMVFRKFPYFKFLHRNPEK